MMLKTAFRKLDLIVKLFAILMICLPLASAASGPCSGSPDLNQQDSLSCTTCSWSGSTYQCASCPSTALTSCVNDNTPQAHTGQASIDTSKCGTCALKNIDGQLACNQVVIQLDVAVSNNSSSSTSTDPNDWQWQWVYTQPGGNTPAVSDACSIAQYSFSDSNRSISMMNDQKAKIIYDLTIPNGWSIPKSNEGPVKSTHPLHVASTSGKITVRDDASEDGNYEFVIQIKKGTTYISSPDPTIINKGSSGE